MRIGRFNHFNEALKLCLELLAHRLGFGRSFVASVLRLFKLYIVNLLNEVRRIFLKQGFGSKRDFITILFKKASLSGILHISSKVTNTEDSLGLLDGSGTVTSVVRDGLILFGEVRFVQTLCPVLITSTLPQFTLIIQHGQNTHGTSLNRIQTILIVGERNEGPVDRLPLIFLLLQLEDELVELLLQGLIRKVNTKLLKGVGGKTLKSKDIQHSCRGTNVLVILPLDTVVDLLHHPKKHCSVDSL
mmetsp:Transcript_13171/g.28796  ORF Transcript_13171/g.28796 Transcript_13171/m.28796 type:complete len:245 (+) Transcript_13171:2923-3657(+)